jgi:pilus assembly protein CpaE
LKKPQPEALAAEDGFTVEDEFALDVSDPWRAPDALARPVAEPDPFADAFDEPVTEDPFALTDAPAYAMAEPASLTLDPQVEPELEAQIEPEHEPMFEPALEPVAAFEAEPVFEPEPEPAFEPELTVEPEVTVAPELMVEPAPAPAPESAPAPVMAADPSDIHGFGHAHHGELSVPRIGIHIFCERPDTAVTAEQSAKDRRMARANTMVRPGGLAAAVQYYQNQPTPPLVIVECLDRGSVLVAQLDQLAEVCDTGTKVVVIGDHNDITLYRELMRRGVSEYLVAPLHTLQLISAITTLYADPAAPFIGRQIAFCGARGGVGSSTIAHNLAHALSEHMQSSTAIVDFDLPFGTAGLDFNQDPLQGVADALSQPDRLDSVLLDRMMVRCTDRLSLFAAPATLDHDYDIAPEAFEEVATKMRTTAPFVILDLPHLWSNWMRRVLLGADEVVITATPDLASLRNAKNIMDLLRQARPNDTPPRLVLNQVGLPGRPEIPTKDFIAALGIDNPIIVPFDAKLFGQAANNGQMIDEVNARAKASESLQALAQMIARRDPPPAAKKSALSGLFKRK